MDKLLVAPPQPLLPTKAVEIVYIDGTVDKFNTEFEGQMNQVGFFAFPRVFGQPPTLIHHLQIRKMTSFTRPFSE